MSKPGKWVLVTGAAKRIGRAIAIELAQGGWNVVVHYNRSASEAKETAAEIKKHDVKAHLMQVDFTDRRAVETMLPSLAAEIGPIAGLVNNAGFFEPDSAVPGGSEFKMVNFEAPRLLCENFKKLLPPGQRGAIVNMLDGCMPDIGFSAYKQAKKALRVLTLELAHRFAPDVRVNGVAPGPVLPAARQSAENFRRLVDATPLKAEIRVEDVATTVRLLLENPSITGEILHIDGGVRLKNTAVTHNFKTA
ncbi:MAG TPA: SDR family NAD(P)-dependent oxidoreductase [Alphaproteobacteria bacterium]|nr:SDR family NAD(P)-dependent oxidoreductase [Alphaproteobacteria bacterium]